MTQRTFYPDQNNDNEQAAQNTADLVRKQIASIHSTQATTARPDPQTDRAAYEQWYYTLTPEQQQAEWDLYYSNNEAPQTQHAQGSHAVTTNFAHDHVTPQNPHIQMQEVATHQPSTQQRNQTKAKIHNPFRSLITAGALALFFSFLLYNEIVIGQVRSYISPNSTVSSPIILDPSEDITVGPETRIIIPKINVDVPIVDDLKTLDESAIQEALNDGVVDYKYPGTVEPGQVGNNVIVGHSSNNFLNSGKYKFAFVLLERLEIDDTFIIHYKKVRYVYKVTDRRVIDPSDFSAVTQTSDKPIATLITCTPPGTSWRRFIIQAEQISPNADTAETVAVPSDTPDINTPVPGNAPSLWSRIF